MPIVAAKRLFAVNLLDLLEDAWIKKSYQLVDKIENNIYADEPSEVIATINMLKRFHDDVRGFCGISLPLSCSKEEVTSWIEALDTTDLHRQDLIAALCPEPGDFFDLDMNYPQARGDLVLLGIPLTPALVEALENGWDYKFSLFRAAFHIIGTPRDPKSATARELYAGFLSNIDRLLELKDTFYAVFGTYPSIKVSDGEVGCWIAAIRSGVQDPTIRTSIETRLLPLINAVEYGVCRPVSFGCSSRPNFVRN